MSNDLLRSLRKVHLYFGLFIAPALLFFAFTGAIQTLSLHESAGTSYTPPALLVELGQLHKKQTTILPPRRPAPPPARAEAAQHAPEAAAQPAPERTPAERPHPAPAAGQASTPAQPPVTLASRQRQHLPMKIFFLAVALGLLTSTLTGIYMAFRYQRNKLVVLSVLVAGVLIPLLLLKF